MKNLFFSVAFMLIGSFAFADNAKISKTVKKVKAFSECCTVTVSNSSTGESATVNSCATTVSAACDRAYKKAKAAVAAD